METIAWTQCLGCGQRWSGDFLPAHTCGELQEYKYQRTYELTFIAFSKEQADQMLREYEMDMKKWAENREGK